MTRPTAGQQAVRGHHITQILVLTGTLLTACSSAPARPDFALDRHLAAQSVVILENGISVDGGIGFLVEDSSSGDRAAVTPASVWDQRGVTHVHTLGASVVRFELHTFGSQSRVLATASGLRGPPGMAVDGPDQSANLMLFGPLASTTSDVRSLQLDPRDQPVEGESLWVLGCASQSSPCVITPRAVEVVSVATGGFSATPYDPGSLHLLPGAPVLTSDGAVVGMYTTFRGGRDLLLFFCPAQAIRDRLGW